MNKLQEIKDDLQSGRIFLDGILYENAVWLIEKLEKTQQALELEREKSSKWEKAFDNADKQYLKKEREAAELRRKLEQSQASNQRLVGCLEWYGDVEHYQTNVVDQWQPVNPVMSDLGERARDTLSEVKGNGNTQQTACEAS